MKGVLQNISHERVNRRGSSPGAGDEEATSSSSSRARFLRPRLLGPLFAADMLGRRGELGRLVSGVVGGTDWLEAHTSLCVEIPVVRGVRLCWQSGGTEFREAAVFQMMCSFVWRGAVLPGKETTERGQRDA